MFFCEKRDGSWLVFGAILCEGRTFYNPTSNTLDSVNTRQRQNMTHNKANRMVGRAGIVYGVDWIVRVFWGGGVLLVYN